MMPQVPGEINRGHPATSDLPLDGVSAGEGGFDDADLVGQRGASGELLGSRRP
jgi:hypothetical protein